MEIATTALSVIEAIVKKCEEIKALPEDCKDCAKVLKRLSPVVKEIAAQLKTREHKSLLDELYRSLQEVERVIDYIAEHPNYTKLFSSTYLEKLRGALDNVDKWIGRIQTVGLSITNQSKTILSGLQHDIKGFITAVQNELRDVKAKLDSLQLQLQSGGSNVDGKLTDILSLLKDIQGVAKDAPVQEKGGRFQDFILEEELRTIQMMGSMAAKVARIPKALLCPITFEVMDNPMINTLSGYTYDEEALRRHMSQCIIQGKPITDPFTREEFDPQKHLQRNRAIADMIAEWKAEHMIGEVLGSPLPPPPPPSSGHSNSSNEPATSPGLKSSSTGDADLVEEGSLKSPMKEDSEEAIAFNKFKSWFIKELGFSAKVAEHFVHLFNSKNISNVDRLQRMLNRNKTLLKEWDIDPIDAEDILEKLFPPQAEAVKVAPVKEIVVTPKEPVEVAPVVPVEKPVVVKQTFSGTAQHTLKGHSGTVCTVIQLSNGRIASASYDKTVKLWDVSRQTCVGTLEGHTKNLNSCTQLSNGQIASGSSDKTIKLWDVQSQTCVATLTGHSDSVYSVIQLSNGQIASVSDDNTIKIWDVSRQTCVATLTGHSRYVRSVIQLSNGQIASASWDKTIKLWDVQSQTCVATLTGHSYSVYSVIQLSNGQLASGSADKTIKLWDVQSQTCVATLTGHSNSVWSVIQLSNGQLASGSGDKTIKLWDISSQTCVATLEGHSSYVWSVIQLSNGQLASGSADKTIKIWT